MRKVDDAIARVRSFRKSRGWAPSRFALEAGLSVNALRGIDSLDWGPLADTLRRLEAIIPNDFSSDPKPKLKPKPKAKSQRKKAA